ncbi:MAG: hypothetical protein DRH24_18295, partial [Deltaproteobacteria bacterium]
MDCWTGSALKGMLYKKDGKADKSPLFAFPSLMKKHSPGNPRFLPGKGLGVIGRKESSENGSNMKLCLVCSSGGHFMQMRSLEGLWREH